MQSDLKMCPFCGGDGEYHSDKGPTGEVYAWVGCNQCDAMSVHCDVRSMQPEETHPIDAWNNRASDAEIARLTEALRAAEEREKASIDALIWCSGSQDFNEGGQAREGWLKLCRPLIDAALKEKPHADA